MALAATKGACQNATPGGWKWNLLLLGVLLPASFAWPLSIFWVCEGSIPNPPNNGRHVLITAFTLLQSLLALTFLE
jgi:hypothetical protein